MLKLGVFGFPDESPHAIRGLDDFCITKMMLLGLMEPRVSEGISSHGTKAGGQEPTAAPDPIHRQVTEPAMRSRTGRVEKSNAIKKCCNLKLRREKLEKRKERYIIKTMVALKCKPNQLNTQR